jgi:hypothetical protein
MFASCTGPRGWKKETRDSEVAINLLQSAKLKFVYVLTTQGGGSSPMKLIEIGRWSDCRATLVNHVRQVMRCAETWVMSSDEEMPFLGTYVCKFTFRMQRSLLLTAEMISSP